jgi:hypothetical protein
MKELQNHPGYFISEDGNFYNSKGKQLKTFHRCKGYLGVKLGKISYYVHRLIAEEFIPNPDNLPQVNHIDKDRSNNSVNNLEWCTSQKNIEHSLAKTFTIEHKNGERFTVHNLNKWCRENNLHLANLHGTISSKYRQNWSQGYRILSVTKI